MIPKIIHQTWKTATIPKRWQSWVESWKRYHPEWDYRFWTDEDCRDFVAGEYPDFLTTYDGYPYQIQRVDAFRYLVLHHQGGVYADMDCECLQPFEQLAESRDFLIAYEPRWHNREHGTRFLPCNALFGSVAGYPFLTRTIQALQRTAAEGLYRDDPLRSTGPVFLFNLYNELGESAPETLSSKTFYPFKNKSAGLTLLDDESRGADLRRNLVAHGTFAVHYWANSWLDQLE